MTRDKAVAVLNHLIETNKDSQKTLEAAAGGVKNRDVKRLLRAYAKERELFASELNAEVERLGGEPPVRGTFSGTLHRGWMNLKKLVAPNHAYAVLVECERGEEAALGAYEEAARQRLPAAVKTVLARQADKVREARDRIRSLEAVLAVA
jgi:uncharacterized protein (TIGR02284 family)